MNLYGSLQELVSLVLRRSSPANKITVQGNASTASAGDLIVELPPKTTGTSTIVDSDTSQTLTNKSMDAATNTLTNITNTSISGSAAIAYSKLNLATSIVNGDINAAAGIAYNKLNLAGDILNSDINAAAAIAYSKLNLATSIVNADIATAAAIVRTKLASGSANQVIINDGSGVLSSEAQLAGTRGGTGISSTATFPATGIVVTEAATETLTNKTLTAGILSGTTTTSNSGELRFNDSTGGHYAGLLANGTTTASVSYTLPAAGPASNGQVLAATTAGVMSWASAATNPQTSAFAINGSADAIQLIVKGNGTQTAALQAWEDNTGLVLSSNYANAVTYLNTTTNVASGVPLTAPQSTSFYALGNHNSSLQFGVATNELFFYNGVYDQGAGLKYTTANRTGVRLRIGSSSALTGTAWMLEGGNSVAGAADSAATARSLGSVLYDGSWTLGVSAGATTHTINARDIYLANSNATSTAINGTPSADFVTLGNKQSAVAFGSSTNELRIDSGIYSDGTDSYSYLNRTGARLLIASSGSSTGTAFQFLTGNSTSHALGAATGTLTSVGTITPAGVVSWPTQIAVGIYTSAAQAGLVSNTSTKVQFNTKEFDIGTTFDAVTNFRWTPGVIGKYVIDTTVRLSPDTANLTAVQINIFKNGSQFKQIWVENASVAISAQQSFTGSVLVDANATDFFEIFAKATASSGTWSILGGQDTTFFSGYKIA